jgi:signal transduction histidine kinase
VPPEISTTIGDILHNLRSALDSLAYEMALRGRDRPMTKKQERACVFPVKETPEQFDEFFDRGSKREGDRIRAALYGDRARAALRIIATGDSERRRLERDLHDGAQQRLVGLSLSLRLARSKLGPFADPRRISRIDQAEKELRVALGELRELANGIFPAVLADEGLAPAVEALAEDARVPIQITALPEGRLEPAVETAAYFVVSEVVRRSRATMVTVGATRRAGQLVVEIERDSDAPKDVVDLEDRVGALDGRLEILRGPGGHVKIRAEIPCES